MSSTVSAPVFDKKKHVLLIPDLFPIHMELLANVIRASGYRVEVLRTHGADVMEAGLKYIHNDMCYPAICSLGQQLHAITSGTYDPADVAFVQFQTGGGCRASNYSMVLRKALNKLGLEIPIVTLGFSTLSRNSGFSLTPAMCIRALVAVTYGDLLLLLTHQTRPWEAVPGAAEACRAQWTARLAEELKTGRGLTLGRMRQVFAQAAADFAKIPLRPGPRRRVALVGELYTKYCALGNWDMVAFLEGEGWEVAVNGFSWYLLYYASNQIAAGGPAQGVWRGLSRWVAGLQQDLCRALADHGFFTLPPFPAFQREAAAWISQDLQVADGWLIGAEAAAWLRAGCSRVLAMQPFGCLPNHVCGRGQYAALVRRVGAGKLVSVDVDASLPRLGVYHRVKLLLEPWEKCACAIK